MPRPRPPPPPSATHSSSAADAEAVAAEALKNSDKVSGREVIDEGLGTTGPVETLARRQSSLKIKTVGHSSRFRTGISGNDTRVEMDRDGLR